MQNKCIWKGCDVSWKMKNKIPYQNIANHVHILSVNVIGNIVRIMLP